MVNDENQRVGATTPMRGRTSERFPFSPMNKTSSLLKTIRDNVQIDDTNKATKAASSATKRSILASPPPSKTAEGPGVLSPPSKNLLSPMCVPLTFHYTCCIGSSLSYSITSHRITIFLHNKGWPSKIMSYFFRQTIN